MAQSALTSQRQGQRHVVIDGLGMAPPFAEGIRGMHGVEITGIVLLMLVWQQQRPWKAGVALPMTFGHPRTSAIVRQESKYRGQN